MVAGGYYAITAVPAVFALVFLGLSVYRLYQLKTSVGLDELEPPIREIQRNWTLITVFLTVSSVLIAVECVDPRGVFGLYPHAVGYSLRFVLTEVLILASFTLMHAFLLTGLAIRQQKVNKLMKPGFMVAAVVKFSVGIGSVIVFNTTLLKTSIVANDWTLFVCFILALFLFLVFLYRIIAVLTVHLKNLAGVSSDTKYLRRVLLRFKVIFFLSAVCLCAVPPFLALNAIKHADELDSDAVTSDPDKYEFEISIWFKLAWACFLFWMVPPPTARAKRKLTLDQSTSHEMSNTSHHNQEAHSREMAAREFS